MIEIQENMVIELLDPDYIISPKPIVGDLTDTKIEHTDTTENADLKTQLRNTRDRVNELYFVLDNTPSSIHLKYETQKHLAEISKELTDIIKECK